MGWEKEREIRMDRDLYHKIDQWMEMHREELVRDICRLVRIPSISNPQEEIKPFGKGCKNALEEMLKMGEEYGFYTHNYENYVGALWLDEGPMEDTIGFWNHLDVVPVGDNWTYDPFNPVVKDGYLIGRGAQDNKGPAVGMMYVMRCLKELQIPLNHRLCLFVGCDEERGMKDLEYYTAHYEVPALSMIADSGFPVCYGEKGILEGDLTANHPFSKEIVSIKGGTASNIIPDVAVAVVAGETAKRVLHRFSSREKWLKDGVEIFEREDKCVWVTVHGTSAHSAFPEGSVNAIQKLFLLFTQNHIWNREDEERARPFMEANKDYYGEQFGIAYEDEASGKLTSAGTMVSLDQGYLTLHFNIRYSITEKEEHILSKIHTFCEKNGCTFSVKRGSSPNYFDRNHPVVDRLTDLYNEITGQDKKPFVMGGGTYARKLPKAFAYGVGGLKKTKEQLECKLFLPQHGDAHQPDEGLYISGLLQALKIYGMSVIEMNGMDL